MTETELVNQQHIKTKLLSKFKELIIDKCNVTVETKGTASVYHLGSKSGTDPKNRPILVRFVNLSLKRKLLKVLSIQKTPATQLALSEPLKNTIATKHF